MGEVLSNLKVRFGVDSSDFKKGMRDGEQAMESFKSTATNAIDDFASMFGVNMSGVTSALDTAKKSLNFLGEGFSGAAKGGNVLAISMKLLKSALIATGIGALVVVLGTLVAYFTKSGEGADKFAKILDQVKSVVNNVIDRLAIFGKGIADIAQGKFKKGWEEMTGAFKGMGTEIKEDWKAAGDLADRLDALEDKEISLINSLEERRAKAAELRLQAKEETEDQKKKLDYLHQASALYKSVFADQISIEKERLAIMKQQIAIQSSDPTDEQNRTIAEQEAKINSLLREQAEQLKGLQRERGKTLELVQQEADLEKMKSEITAPSKVATIQIVPVVSVPDLAPLHTAIKAASDEIATVSVDLSSSINSAFGNISSGLGEMIGALASGNAGMSDLGNFLAGSFADLAINVGKTAIATGMAVLGIKKALMSLNPYVAIAAGIALIAVGSAIKGSLSSAASGGGGSTGSISGGGSSSGGSLTYGSRTATPENTTKQVVSVPIFSTENIAAFAGAFKDTLAPLITEFRAVGTAIVDAIRALTGAAAIIQPENPQQPATHIIQQGGAVPQLTSVPLINIMPAELQQPVMPAIESTGSILEALRSVGPSIREALAPLVLDFSAVNIAIRDSLLTITGANPLALTAVQPVTTGNVRQPQAQQIYVTINGKLTADGKDLSYVISQEAARINIVT